ncbi:MAG: PF20097 family protein [Eubacteriales bacterium]|nr:PF20097 family protein [Eubacteriales bacterium]
MKCPYCGKEMEKGKASCMTLQGFAQIMLSYTSDEELKNKFFKRKTQDTVISPGEEAEAYYCAHCKKIMPVFNL